jgi:Yip1 domain
LTQPEESFGHARPDPRARKRRALAALTAPLAALLFPDRAVPPIVATGRFRAAMAITIVSALLAAAAIWIRIDVGPEVRAASGGDLPPQAASTGEDQPVEEVKTDTEVEEEIEKRTAVVRVKVALAAALGTPAKILFLALGLFLLGRYVGGKPTTQGALAAAAVGSLPWAVRSLIAAAAALRQPAIAPADLDGLVAGGFASALGPSALATLLGGVDLFTLWSVVLCGFGLSAAAGIGRVRSFVAVAIGFAFILMLTSMTGAR